MLRLYRGWNSDPALDNVPLNDAFVLRKIWKYHKKCQTVSPKEFIKSFSFKVFKKKNIICSEIGHFRNEIAMVSRGFTTWPIARDTLYAPDPMEGECYIYCLSPYLEALKMFDALIFIISTNAVHLSVIYFQIIHS